MKLRSLAVNQFKKFTTPTRLDGIEDGLNIVIGPNEMGKSTLLDALCAVVFEKHNSRARPITALQNHRNQAAPVVELEFELEDGRYRIAKRFIKKPYARLSCPDGRTLEGDTAEETLRHLLCYDEPGKTGAKPETLGMWNVLWVQQGRSFGALDLPNSARSSLHSALESEVGTVLGGRRGRALPQAVEEQLGELTTRATSRPRGKYKEMIGRIEILGRELDDLRARRENLTQTLSDLENAQDTLERLSSGEPDKVGRKELAEARKRHGQLAELESRIARAAIELELRNRNLEQAKQEAASRQRLKDDIGAEEVSLAKFGKRRADVRKQGKEARNRLHELRSGVRESETAVTKADETVSRQRRVVSAVERRDRINELKGRHQKADAAEKRQRAARQKAAAILVTEDAVRAIREATIALEKSHSRLSAVATLISFEMRPEGLSDIDVDGKPLSADQPSLQAVEPVTITIPERGSITIEPVIKDRDELLRHERDANIAQAKALERAGAKSPNDAEDQHTERQKILQVAELARHETELLAPATEEYPAGALALSDYIEGVRQVLKRELEYLRLEELPTRQNAETTLRVAQEQAGEARSMLDTARAALRGPEDAFGTLQTELGTLQGRYDESQDRLVNLQGQLAQAEKNRSDNELQAAVVAARAARSDQQNVITGLTAQRTDETVLQLEARIGRLEKALQDRRDKRADLKEKIAGLKSRVEAAEGVGLDEAIGEKARDLELCEENRRRMDRDVKVLSLLLSTLRSAEQEAKARYLSPVLNRVRPYLQLLFPGADISIDENLHITGLVREAGHDEAFHHLSMGTQEQIAVLVRLAFAEMLVEQGQPATVVLDDALVFSDDRRMSRMFDILNIAARTVQVIALTCREQLFEELGAHPLSLADASAEELVSA